MRVSQVHQALLLPRLTQGISSKAMGLCWGPGALLAVLIGTSNDWYYGLIPIACALAVHSLLRWSYKKDHRVFDIYIQYASMASRYHPNSREKLPVPFERPFKVGRGLRM